MKPVIVIGHKNPDTDSVCSAICYANLKTILTGRPHIACRAGQVNAESQYVLDTFGVEPPQYLESLRPRLSDVQFRDVRGVNSHASLKRAWEYMRDNNIRTIPLTPRRALVELKGSFRALTEENFYLGTTYPQSYLHITLTDEEDIPDALGRLRRIYPYIMVLSFDNRRTRAVGVLGEPDREEKSPFDLFSEFYEVQNNAPMTRKQADFVRALMEEIWEERQ